MPGLELVECSHLRSENVAYVSMQITGLEELELASGERLTDHQVLRALIGNTRLGSTLHTPRLHDCKSYPPLAEDDEEMPGERIGDWVELPLGAAIGVVTLPQIDENVRRLCVSYCGWMTSGFLTQIGLNMSHLEYLGISGCPNLKDDGTLEGLIGLDRLESLLIDNMRPNVTGGALQHLPALNHHECRDSQGIGGEDVCCLMAVNQVIKHIDLGRCRDITRRVIDC